LTPYTYHDKSHAQTDDLSNVKTGCQEKLDLVFALDSSGSVGEENFERFKSFVKSFLDDVDVESCQYRIGFMKYGSNALVQFHLNAYTSSEELITAIDGIGYSHGHTYTGQALRVARQDMFTTARGDR